MEYKFGERWSGNEASWKDQNYTIVHILGPYVVVLVGVAWRAYAGLCHAFLVK